MTQIKFQNKNRIAEINTNSDGDFVAYIGIKDDGFHSGMQVFERRTYKRQSSSVKFCEKWING